MPHKEIKYVELILFDLDGTLVDSLGAIISDMNLALKKIGLPEKSAGEIASYIGTGVDDLVRKSLGHGGKGLLEKARGIFENYRRIHPGNLRLYPGVKDILEHFKDKKKTIITNGKREFALLALKRTNIDSYFDNVIGGDDVKCMKPSSCPLDIAVDKFKVDRTKSLIVGDMDIDILAGKKAGIATCAVTYGIGKKEDILKANPDYVIDDILKLKEIIQ
jgi:HAD superfamily hydrolase (TIGR01509 family)